MNHTRAAFGPSGFRTDRDNHLIARRNLIEPIRPIFADPNHLAAITGTSNAVGFGHPLYSRQALRQCACSALLASNGLFAIGYACRDLFLDEGDLGLCLGDRSLQVLQRQFYLRWIQISDFGPNFVRW